MFQTEVVGETKRTICVQ